MDYTFRSFTLQDVPQIMDLQRAYNKIYPAAIIIPEESYLSPAFAGGENIICAFNEDDILKGYSALVANLASEPGVPHTVWAVIKVDPALSSPRPLQDTLFEKVVKKAGDVTRVLPGHETRLTFQHHTSEVDAIEYLKAKGCAYTESIFRMRCDLSKEPAFLSVPAGIEIRYNRMEDDAEQQSYVAARNEAFPASATTLADWQYFLRTFVNGKGKVIGAFDKQQLVGSLVVYWDEALNRRIGISMGTTEFIFVKDSWRKRGIATCMINQCLKYLKENGLKESHLEVYAANQRALELYKKIGYKVISETQLYRLIVQE